MSRIPKPAASFRTNRTVAFWIVTLLMPILLFVLVEGLLYLVNYGDIPDLVVKRMMNGREFYTLNRHAATLYFRGSGFAIPEFSEDRFAVKKTNRTKRIFCIGESTMAGFPYDFHATPPSILASRLHRDFPAYDIEVVNVGLSAVGSFILADLIDELSDFEPDAIIVYSGHNEFYGAYGAASSVGAGRNPILTRLSLRLLRFRTYLALRDIGSWIESFLSPPRLSTGPLMAEMVAEEVIPYGGRTYEETREAYRENIVRMIAIARRNDIPIILTALVSNLRDHPPFRSSPSDDSAKTHLIHEGLGKGDSATAAGQHLTAEGYFRQVLSIDSTHALAWFKLAKTLDKLGHFEEAKHAYEKARDYDAMRFRASGDFQVDLIRLCESLRVPIARTDLLFQQESRNGIPGNELFTEHVHPNIRGYELMASSIQSTLREHQLLFGPEEWIAVPRNPDSFYRSSYNITVFDTLVGSIKIDILRHQWPFVQRPTSYRYEPRSRIESIVHEYVRGKIAWSSARYALADQFAEQRLYGHARAECLAVSRVIPFSYEPLLRVADLFRKEGRNGEALEAYSRCVEAEDNPYARLKRSIVLLEQERAEEAAEEIENAFSLVKSSGFSLNIDATANAHYLLAVAYAKLGVLGKARQNAERALTLRPSDGDTKDLLDQIRQLEKTHPR